MLLDEPNLYNAVNWLTMGAADTVSGAIAPEEPLSLQHWMDSYATVMLGYGAWKSGKSIAGTSKAAADAGNKKINSKGNIADEKYANGTLSNVEARKWYLEQETKISELIDKSLPLEEQAKQAFELRNQFRTKARELMADRATAVILNKTDPNYTWEQIVQKQINRGLSGDEIYKAIIDSSQRSRTSINKSLGLEREN